MRYFSLSFGIIASLLSAVKASPAPVPAPQATPTPVGNSSSEAMTASAAPTEIAVFTANGGVYTATEISSMVAIAGYQLSIGGPGALVGGVDISAASDGIINAGQTAPYVTVTGVSTAPVTSTSTGSDGSTTFLSSSETVAATAASLSAAGSGDGESAPASSATGASESASSSAGAMPLVTVRPKSVVAALGGVAGLLCLLG